MNKIKITLLLMKNLTLFEKSVSVLPGICRHMIQYSINNNFFLLCLKTQFENYCFYYFTICKFFTSVLTGGFSLKSER